jgi:hypothetical protein
MALIGSLFKRALQVGKSLQFALLTPNFQQKIVLIRLLRKARNTEIGKYYGFSSIMDSGQMQEEFSRRIPIHDYNMMHNRWWKSYDAGRSNITWPGKIKYFALSSGTSEAASKYIPVSGDMIKSMRRTSIKQMFALTLYNFPTSLFDKGVLMLGGSANLKFSGHYYYGDLSGINTSRVPLWFNPFFKPGEEIVRIRDWNEKIEQIVLQAPGWDIWVVTGVPAWVQLLFERIIERYKVQSIHNIWPNLQVFAYGGVAIEPYLPTFDKLCHKPLIYIETYLASEGFIAYDARHKDLKKGMRLNLNNGIYYEFIPFDEHHFDEDGQILPGVQAIPLDKVEVHRDYALLMSTCSGAWRYLIGDTIRFESLEHMEIRITGRTKHFLSLCGEHLSMENINEGLLRLSQWSGIAFGECAVMGISEDGIHGHRWYLSVEDAEMETTQFRKTELIHQLDQILREINDDYAVERMHALQRMEIEIIPARLALEWMASMGKVGGQHKFPRVLKGVYAASWTEFLDGKV